MIPPEAYQPAPGWYRHYDVLRWYDGRRWTDQTRPLPRPRALPNARPWWRRTPLHFAAVVAGVLALAAATVVLGLWRVIW